MATIPTSRYITSKIMAAILSWLTLKLQTEISTDDACRAINLEYGPRQQDPKGVCIQIFENNLSDPDRWPHAMDPLLAMTSQQRTSGVSLGRITGRLQVARETVGENPERIGQRSFTIKQEVWMDRIAGIERTEENLLLLSGIVAGRVRRALKDGGPGFGTGQPLVDDFGEMTVDGPFFGNEWVIRQVGKAGFQERLLQVWYRTIES